VIGIGWWLADELDKAKEHLHRFETGVIIVLAVVIIALFVWRKLRRSKPVPEV
jgi:membrane protein DedA with SNARE-associated domain